jgi:AraC-like DNA-binding protein
MHAWTTLLQMLMRSSLFSASSNEQRATSRSEGDRSEEGGEPKQFTSWSRHLPERRTYGFANGAMTYNRWSTLHIEPKDRLEFWRDAGEKAKTPVTPHVPSPRDFEATLTMRGLGDVALNHVQVQTPHDVEITRSDLARLEQPYLLVDVYLSGAADVSQMDRRIQAAPSQPFLIDGRREYRLDHQQPVSMLALAVPFAALGGRREAALEKLFAQQQPQNAALHMLAGQMRMLSTWPHPVEAAEGARLSDLLVGTLHAVLDGVTDSEIETGAARRERNFLRRRVQQLIEQMHADPSLSPQLVAAKLGISIRTLHAQMARDGTSFGAELLAYRLERTYGLLRTARRDVVTIREISFRCGFVSAAHFSRSFRARFGVAPSEVMRNG